MLSRLAGILLIVIAASCKNDNEPDFPDPIVSVDPQFQEIVEAFLEEAHTRGKHIELENLIVQLASPAVQTCGSCNSTDIASKIQKIVNIQATACWDNPQQREALIFHELGHCVLGREHNSQTLPNGDPKSIMAAGNISMYSPCIYVIGEEDCNYIYKRAYYLDELFDENTPAPAWSK